MVKTCTICGEKYYAKERCRKCYYKSSERKQYRKKYCQRHKAKEYIKKYVHKRMAKRSAKIDYNKLKNQPCVKFLTRMKVNCAILGIELPVMWKSLEVENNEICSRKITR